MAVASAPEVALGFFVFALIGGVLVQTPFSAAKGACDAEDAVAAARLLTIAQGAGLTAGALVDVAVALGTTAN